MLARSPSALLAVYAAQFKVHIAMQRQYLAISAIWLLGTVLQPVISLTVWANVARARSGAVAGYDAADFATYYLALMVISYTTATGIFYEFETQVREGTLSFQLLRPLHPFHGNLADNLTYKLMMLPFFLPALALLIVAFRPALTPTPATLGAFGLALLLSFALRFTAGWLVALSAFWTTRVGALIQIYYTATMFLSGSLAPLALLPGPLAELTYFFPFRWMIAFPLDLLQGRLGPREIAVGFAAQGGWALAQVGLFAILWRRGVRRYSAVGA